MVVVVVVVVVVGGGGGVCHCCCNGSNKYCAQSQHRLEEPHTCAGTQLSKPYATVDGGESSHLGYSCC